MTPTLAAACCSPSLTASCDPVHAAVLSDDADAIRRCAASGMSVNCPDAEGRTPAMVAVLRGARGALEALLDLGIDHAALDQDGRSIFDYFPLFGRLDPQRLSMANAALVHLAVEETLDSVARRVSAAGCVDPGGSSS